MFTKLIFALVILCVIAIIDLATYKIPDVLLIVMLIGAVVFDAVLNPKGIIYAALSCSILTGIFYTIYKVTCGIGFGDVKLSGCVAYTFGFFDSVCICFFACVLGIFYFAIYKFICKKRIKRIPFAPFVFTGTLIITIARRFCI